jgi:thiamine pyrophosphate-dependent acetolactate synthase large subunit-like protein
MIKHWLCSNIQTSINNHLITRLQRACGGKGYAIKEPNEVKSIMHQGKRKPTIIEAYVDPYS